MTIIYKDRVKETTTTAGTGTLSLGGAVTGYQGFAAIGDGMECFACVHAVYDNGMPTGQWEVFRGTYTASGSTLSRTTVLSSSTGSVVDFAEGTKYVVCSIPAADLGQGRPLYQVVFQEHILKSTSANDTGPLRNVLRVQQGNAHGFSCVYCVASGFVDSDEGHGVALGWGNSLCPDLIFKERAYLEAYDTTAVKFRPATIIQSLAGTGSFRRYEAQENGDQVFRRRDTTYPDETVDFTIDGSGNVIVGSSALATDATNGFFRIPSCAGTPTGAAADGSMVRDSTNHKVYFRSGGNWIALN